MATGPHPHAYLPLSTDPDSGADYREEGGGKDISDLTGVY